MGDVDLFLMSPPGPKWRLRGRANFRSAGAASVSSSAAIREWLALADAITARGGEIACIPPDREGELTGLPFAAECGHIVEHEGQLCCLLPNMAAPHRRGERELVRPCVEALGLTPIDLRDGIWEAQGDVAEFRDRVLLFYGGRTNREGLASARPFFPEDAIVLEIREPAFHGNMAVLPLPAADRILACPDVMVGGSWGQLVDAFGDALVPVTVEELRSYATNGLPIGCDVLAPHMIPSRVEGILHTFGLHVERLPMAELCEKAGGASRCLVSRARVPEGRIHIPPELHFRSQRPRILASAEPSSS